MTMRWRTIKSIPSFTYVIVYGINPAEEKTPQVRIAVATDTHEDGSPYIQEGGDGVDPINSTGWSPDLVCTHWMPLPAPPKGANT